MYQPTASFGQRLRQLRVRAGLSQAALAERAGLAVAAVAALERGVRRSPYAQTVGELCEALGLTSEERPVVPKRRGQRPRREVAEQSSLLDESYTAAPEADKTVSTKLAGLVGRARKEARLTNVVQYVDEELLRLAFRSLRKQASPGVDGQSYEENAATLHQILNNVHTRLTTAR